MAERREHKKPVHTEIGYERRDVNITKILYASAFILGFLILTIVLLNEYFLITVESVVYEQVLSPESEMLLQHEAYEDSILNSYGVVDEFNDLYRIPIERAMEIMVEETGKK